MMTLELAWKVCGHTSSMSAEFRTASNVSRRRIVSTTRTRAMGGGGKANGVFAPVVVVARNVIGTKRFNQLRGKAIALHSQVITEFCKSIGADNKVRQGLIRVAKKNGEKLGFLA